MYRCENFYWRTWQVYKYNKAAYTAKKWELGFITAAISIIFINPLTLFIGGSASESLYKFTKEYLTVMAVSIPAVLFSLTVYNQLRLCGNVKDGMKGLTSGMIINIVLDPVFIFGSL